MNIDSVAASAVRNVAQPNLPNIENAKNKQEIERVAEELVANFWTEFLKSMPEMTKSENRFGGGKVEEHFKMMLVPEQAKILSKEDKSGLKTQIVNHLMKIQEINK